MNQFEYKNYQEDKYKLILSNLLDLEDQHVATTCTAEAILGPCREEELPSVKGINDQMRTLASQILIFILKHVSFEIPSIASQNLDSPIHLFLKEIADPTIELEYDYNNTSEDSMHFIFELKTSNGEIIDSILLNSDQNPEIFCLQYLYKGKIG